MPLFVCLWLTGLRLLMFLTECTKHCISKGEDTRGLLVFEHKLEHFLDAANAGADILLAASVFHFHLIDIGDLKDYLFKNGVAVYKR